MSRKSWFLALILPAASKRSEHKWARGIVPREFGYRNKSLKMESAQFNLKSAATRQIRQQQSARWSSSEWSAAKTAQICTSSSADFQITLQNFSTFLCSRRLTFGTFQLRQPSEQAQIGECPRGSWLLNQFCCRWEKMVPFPKTEIPSAEQFQNGSSKALGAHAGPRDCSRWSLLGLKIEPEKEK